ncbi:MAG: PIG-L family deacetylase [Dehalococcoidia bacterium]|nr:PIG-L family deacetylase [Dehalococcoidia bacterium]
MPTLLVVVPHPDDEAYAFGGTISLAARAGWRCRVHCASAGERGQRYDGGAPDPASVGAARLAELAASCAILGAEPPVCWGLPDGRLADDARGPALTAAALREEAPALVLALGADGAYGHPDHLAVFRWVVGAHAALAAPQPRLLFAAFPRGLFLPQYRLCVSMMGLPPQPPASAIGAAPWRYRLDIRAVAAQKLAAVGAHRSQLPGGDPHALFPPGILAALMAEERFAGGARVRSEG